MEKARRDSLKAVISRVRGRVEESLRQQLVGYGLFTDTPPLSRVEAGIHPNREAHYHRVLDAVKHEARAVGSNDTITPEAVARFVRQLGGTWVNRLAALRALEARRLLDPAAALVGDEYGGLSPRAQRLRERAAEAGQPMAPDEALRLGIEDSCRELSESVRVLFDLSDEQSLFWPDRVALREVLRLFSTDVTSEDWTQPDVLGWVYQYYNTEANAELKTRKNTTTGFTYRPDDIPVANQFYTPDWVVRMLTDNTLGRLWLEAQDRIPQLEPYEDTQDGNASTRHRLIDPRHGVPNAAAEPAAFRAWIAEDPDVQRDATVDRLCRFLVPLPSHPVPRAKKPVRDIRILDPACGSGHFLLYAFDILFAMYREAEPDLAPRAIPALILERNLFGIDIDLRAAQLAAFDLYLKARSTLETIDPAAKLQLRGLNIVVADTHIGDDPRKQAFLDLYRSDPDVQQLYRKILTDLDHTNALGSLIKVRTEFETLFGRIRRSREQARKAIEDGLSPAQPALFDTSAQLELRDTYRSASGRTWTIRELLGELRAFEGEVAPSQDIGGRLFYTDLERAVGLLGLLSEQYDVVLMNPPYGDMPQKTKEYLKGDKKQGVRAHYPRTHEDLYGAFVEQAVGLAQPNGLIGCLVPWTLTFIAKMRLLREEILSSEGRPELIQEYGYGVLDGATVGTIGLVARKLTDSGVAIQSQHVCVFNRLSDRKRDSEKLAGFLNGFNSFCSSGQDRREWFLGRLSSLRDVPGIPYAYWASDKLRQLFRLYPAIDHDSAHPLEGRPDTKVADVKFGLSTKDDARFLRCWWETKSEDRGAGRRWNWLVKGGRENSFYARVDHVINWDSDGAELKEWASTVYGSVHWSRTLQGHKYFGKPGVTFNRRSWRLRPFGLVGIDHIYSDSGAAIIPLVASGAAPLMGLVSSSLLVALRLMQSPERKIEVRTIANLPVVVPLSERIGELALRLAEVNKSKLAGDETCRDFVEPTLRRAALDHIREFASSYSARPPKLGLWLETSRIAHQQLEAKERSTLSELDQEVYRLFDITESDRLLIERELARRPKAAGDDGGDSGGDDDDDERENDETVETDSETIRESIQEEDAEPANTAQHTAAPVVALDIVASGISYYLKRIIEADEDGIVPIDTTHGEPALVIRLRESMERDLAPAVARAIEEQAPEYLRTKDLAEWLLISREITLPNGGRNHRAPLGFFPWHVDLYRNRPIFWLLSSENFEKGRTHLTFRVYLHYLKLTADTLPRLLAYYLDPTLESAEREWHRARDQAATLEGRAKSATTKTSEEWLNTVAALKAFRAALDRVIQGPEHAQQVPLKARWLERTIADVRGGRDLGHGYQPHIDHGVRVNITPLAEQKLLPRVTLKKLGG